MESGSRLHEFASSFHHNIPPYRVSRPLDGAKASGAASQTGRDRRSEVIDPASNGLVGDRDPRSATNSSTSWKPNANRAAPVAKRISERGPRSQRVKTTSRPL